MSYNDRINWKDHVRDSDKVKITNNSDGTSSIEKTGKIIQAGVPQSATNFNRMDEALQHIGNAYDLLFTMTQAEIRDLKDRNEVLEKQVATLTAS